MRRLVTIPISHFCEKARWALERAALPYSEERHVQGVHRVAARRAGGGSTVPVLVTPDGVFAESEEILAYADRSLPEPLRLFPDDPELRQEVEQLSRSFDEGLGPDGRRLMYARMLEQRRLMLKVNCQGVPAWERRAMTVFWRAIVPWAKRELSITTDSAATDEPRVRSAFDAVAERLTDGRRYLCGERFTAADLTFASPLGGGGRPPAIRRLASAARHPPRPHREDGALFPGASGGGIRSQDLPGGALSSRPHRKGKRRAKRQPPVSTSRS